MAQSSVTVNSGIGFSTALGLLFIALKLTGFVAWTWTWVLAPFWIPWMFALCFLLVVGGVLGIGWVLDRPSQRELDLQKLYREKLGK